MRAPLPLGAILASSCLHQVKAQAPGYGNPAGGSGSQTNGVSQGVSNGIPVGTVAGFPGGFPSPPTCVMQGTQTVFVTVYATSPPIVSGGSASEGSTPDQTIFKTLHPTKTVLLSPVPEASPFEVQTTVTPFTTITIDFWGTGTDAVSNLPGGTGAFVTVPTEGPQYSSVAGLPVTETSGTTTSPWYTVVTDTEVQWIPGSTGPSQVTILSPHTFTLASAPSSVSDIDAATTCLTVIGPDGSPTVVEVSGSILSQGSPVTSTGAAVTSPASVSIASADITSCTTYTTIGVDGLPTVVESTYVIASAPTAAGVTGSFPTDVVPSASSAPIIPNGAGITTCTSYTVIGADGAPTVVESTWVLPGPMQTQQTVVTVSPSDSVYGVPGAMSTDVSGQITPAPGSSASVVDGGVTTCSTYTVIGADGIPTVVETTFVIVGPATSTVSNELPAGVVTGDSVLITGVPERTVQVAGGVDGFTTCVTYTTLGTNGLPTVVESTVVLPFSTASPTQTTLGFPTAAPQQTVAGLPQGLTSSASASGAVTTCITVDIVGPNGVVTPITQTVVLAPTGSSSALPVVTTLGYPTPASQQTDTDLPQGIPPSVSGAGITTTCVTVDVVGTDGVATPVVQTVVLTLEGSGIVSVVTTSAKRSISQPSLDGYGSLVDYGTPVVASQTFVPPVIVGSTETDSPVVSGVSSQLPPSYGNSVVSVDPTTQSSLPPAYGGFFSASTDTGAWASSALYGPVPSASLPSISTSLETSTWINVIPETTTTYTIKFPLTTMATVTVPAAKALVRRALRRQQSSVLSGSMWSNSSATPTSSIVESTSLPASLSSISESDTTTFPPPFPTTTRAEPTISVNSTSTTSASTAPTVCATGGEVGNFTVDFDGTPLGPLFNPSSNMWFSEGFLVAPPSSDQTEPYTPSSGGQLVEFVPQSLSNTTASGTGDTAEISVGPQYAIPCFRFDFFSANLGCAAQGNEQWCDFEISAYRFDDSSRSEQSIAWSETKRIPACATFPHGGCPLTPVTFDGYSNISSVLISVHVGLDLRVWWGDDFKMGWTENSCEAAQCRGGSPKPPTGKRETIRSALRRGVWHWTPSGLEKLDDAYIWRAMS